MRRCSPVLLALALVSVAACAASAPAQSSSEAPPPAQNSRVGPLEPGFTHCCGDVDYVMQVDCSDRLLRCYANERGDWHQTYGRNCKTALGSGCYERGCLSVCEQDY